MKLGALTLPALSLVIAMGCAEEESAAPTPASAGGSQEGGQAQAAPPEVSRVTLDIQTAIEEHIAAKTVADGGNFKLEHEGEKLELRLVRVHREYLSKLSATSHFACVDLATTDGDVYDVDFFLGGESGDMRVTETTVHKHNGNPYYVWRQAADKTWARAPFEGAPPELLGVVTGSDSFEFIYRSETPAITESGTMWIPLATGNAFQKVDMTAMKVPGEQQIVTDQEYGNRILVLSLGPEDSHQAIEIRYQVERQEKAPYDSENEDLARYLEPDKLVPRTDDFEEIATKAIGERVLHEQSGDLERARALYDHVINEMRYAKIGNQYGKGSAQYACDVKSGNCTDYHSYFIALARSVGIPARFAIGASIPSNRDEGGMSGYHCWAEFHAEGKWWPIDISEADKCTPLSTYYFGRHPANRVELSRGRDLVVNPLPASGPINFLAYPVLEVDGEEMGAKRDFSFRRNTAGV